jgi:Caspase domain/SEFIR domain
MTVRKPPRLFFSYSHDSSSHDARVLALAKRLAGHGCDCHLDQYEPNPAEGWPQWMDRQLDAADFVLIVCTASYYRKAKAGRRTRSGRGVKFESVLVVGDLYTAGMWNDRFIPVLFEDLPEKLILRPLRGYTRYRVEQPAGYEALLRHLTGQPLHPRPQPGKVPDLPPAGGPARERQAAAGAKRQPIVRGPASAPAAETPAGPVTGGRHALLIAIDRYPNLPGHNQLGSCVNDAQALAWLLLSRFSFRDRDIERLMDAAATQGGIRAAVTRLLERVGPEDVVVLYYSGFGSVAGNEDVLEGTIVPYDSGRAPSPVLDIGDHEIGLWLRRLADRCAHVAFVFDSCHSGQILRDGFGAKERYVGPTPSLAGSLGQEGSADSLDHLASRCVLLTACAPHEAAFTLPAEQAGGVSHGAFTYRLCQALARARGGTTYRELFEELVPLVSTDLPSQHPQFRGDGSIPIFGLFNLESRRDVPIRQAAGRLGTVVLAAGVASGVTAGSTWDVYPPGRERFDPAVSPLGRVEVTRVSDLESEARLVSGSLGAAGAPGAPPARAVESTRRYGEMVYPVEIRLPASPSPPHLEAVQRLRAAIARSRVLRLHRDDGMAAARVYLLPARRAVHDGPVPALGPLAEDTWAVVGRDGELLLPPLAASEAEVEATLVGRLDRRARCQFVMDLTDPGGPLTGQVRLALLGREGDRWVERGVDPGGPAPSEPVFCNGERMAFQIAHTHSAPLYFFLLDLGLSGAVTMIYPTAGGNHEPAPAERATLVGTKPGEELTLHLPAGFPVAGTRAARQRGWLETLKLFATTHADGHPVGRLLEITLQGYGLRSATAGQAGEGQWTVVQRSFRLLP